MEEILKKTFLGELSKLSIDELIEIRDFINKNEDGEILNFHAKHEKNFKETNKLIRIVNAMSPQEYNDVVSKLRQPPSVSGKSGTLSVKNVKGNVETSAKTNFKNKNKDTSSGFIVREVAKANTVSRQKPNSNAEWQIQDPSTIGGNVFTQFFENNEGYSMHDPKGDGDCFFYVLEEALRGSGNDMNISQLRNLIAENADKIIETDHHRYNDSLYNIYKYDIEFDIKLKQRSIETTTNEKKNAQTETAIKRYDQFIEKHEHDLEILKLRIKNVNNINTFKNYIKSREFWADFDVIYLLYKLLNIKFILFSQETDNLIYCLGDINPDNDETKYILSAFTGDHYKLITYKDKKIFTFNELPEEIKIQYNRDCNNNDLDP